MPTLRFGKVWLVIRLSGIVFCNLGTSKTVILQFVTTVNIVTPYLSPCNSDHPNNVPSGQKSVEEKKMVEDKYVLIPSTTACYLTIAGYGFFFLGANGSLPDLRFGGACGLGVGAF